ncbi:hypothetical protein V6M85_09925 [Sulfolobus tengchongensis]|uniref:Uncharacterized protein n=1 Tax=Sulfolobus tengchongensis TaxID=207809 RepID=A0AAX4KYD3_9CREN
MNQVLEGYFLRYRNVIWSVKGCYHPEGYAVALPRMFNGMKIKKLSTAMELVRNHFSYLLKHVSEIGFEVPLVPLNESEILDPFKARVNEPLIKTFLNFFNNEIGITGSYLYLGSGKDIDFLSFKAEHYRTLEELREKGITEPLTNIEESELETLDSASFKLLKSKRILEGMFKGIGYTFKIVECEDFGTVKGIKEFDGEVKVIKLIKPFTLPVKYLGIDKNGNQFILTSFRTRFTELPVNSLIYVKGKILLRDNFNDMDLDLAEVVKLKSF